MSKVETQATGKFAWEKAILADKNLSREAKYLALVLGVSMDAETGICWPGKAALCAALNYTSPTSLKNPRAELSKAGYLWARWNKSKLRTVYTARLPLQKSSTNDFDKGEKATGKAQSRPGTTFESRPGTTHKQEESNNHKKALKDELGSSGCSLGIDESDAESCNDEAEDEEVRLDDELVSESVSGRESPENPTPSNSPVKAGFDYEGFKPFRATVSWFHSDGSFLRVSEEKILSAAQEDVLYAQGCSVYKIKALA